jgi:hypothetical protein
MRSIAFFVLFHIFILYTVAADDQSAVTASNELELQISTTPGIKFGFTRKYVFPFMQGESPLSKDNNIELALSAEVAPIAINGLVGAVWTPIAFFQLSAGTRIGTGWNISLLGKEIIGIGLNYSNANGKAEHSGSPFDGLMHKTQVGAALQADLAAIYPGDWHHVIIRTYHEINWQGYTRAKADESWYFEDDDGENCNGTNYYGNLVIGYQMPIFLNMVALLTEADLYLYDQPNRSYWGDDKIRWTFSGVLNFSITRQLSAALITQFITQRNFVQPDWKDLYYRNRQLNTSTPVHLEFYRVAAMLTYKL